jgi:amidase
MAFIGQEILIKAQAKGPLTSSGYTAALAKCRRYSRTEGIDKVLQEHQLDAIIAPTGCPPWITDPVNGDHYYGGCTSPPAVAGYPHVTVPAGFVHDLPVGLSFIGAAYCEPTLIRLAYAFEQATRFRKPPRFLKTARRVGKSHSRMQAK